MAKLQEPHIFSGMQRGLNASKHPAQFIYEGLNVRLTAREDNSLLSITNEKGTESTEITISGIYIGHCLLNQYLVIFSTTSTVRDTNGDASGKDYITRIDLGTRSEAVLYDSSNGNLNLCTLNPIDAIASYESEDVQKIYWTDGFNQPRVINISPKNDNNISSYIPTSFDFIPELLLEETVTVEKKFSASGEFPSGVIQYAFTYYNKYGQETNIFYTTRLYHVAFRDRGASPESKVNIAFKITINNLDSNFKYLRIYSIQRTSLNAVPICKRVQDIDIKEKQSVTYTDTGVNGDSIDPTELLYKGGEPVIAQTLEQKDNTLFLGNITLKREPVPQTVKSMLHSLFSPENVSVDEWENNEINWKNNEIESEDGFPLSSSLSSNVGQVVSVGDIPYVNTIEYSGLKSREVYRIGIQFQHVTGRWSEPVWLRDYRVITSPHLYEHVENAQETLGEIKMPSVKVCIADTQESTVYTNMKEALLSAGYKKARLLMAQPTNTDRTILCQGIANQVVYTNLMRKGRDYHGDLNNDALGTIYAQSSWIFRPVYEDSESIIDTDAEDGGGYVPSSGKVYDSSNLEGNDDNGSLISSPQLRSTEIGAALGDNRFRIDSTMVTIHTPELIFDDALFSEDWSGVGIKKTGYAIFNNTFGDIDLQTKTPTIGSAQGFIHRNIRTEGNAALVSGLFYKDYIVDDTDDTPPQYQSYTRMSVPVSWPVFMWHRTGSLNNDVVRSGRSAELLKKRISNYHVSREFHGINITPIAKKDIQLFHSDEVGIVKVEDHLYMGNVNTALTSEIPEAKYFAGTATGNSVDGTGVDFGSDIKWKLSLKDPNDSNSENGLWKQVIENNAFKWQNVGEAIGNKVPALCIATEPIVMKYKSTPHLVAMLSNNNLFNMQEEGSLPMVELTREYNSDTMFGGMSEDALKSNIWIPISKPVPISVQSGQQNNMLLLHSDRGDTWYQRFDCLKTYPFTEEDVNQVIDIASFMVETHINIDGRYDRNRGQVSNLNVRPTNYNLYNPVYSQADNFFTYRILDSAFYENRYFPNQITWTKEKLSSAETDLWTNITLASTYDMDGSKGEVTSLNTWKDQIFCFQRKGVSNILFNSRVQIPASDGVPIEISNNYKVDGYRYISDGIGCDNKRLIRETSSGIYFMDSVGNHLFHIGEGLQDLSEKCNMTTWFKDNEDTIKKVCFDDINHDVYLVQESEGKALCFSEKLGQFTGLYDYGGIDLIETYNGHVFTLKEGSLYKMFEGEYCKIFGVSKPWEFTFIGNGGTNNVMTLDKIFTNLEFRAVVENDGTTDTNTGRFTPSLPVDYIETWNEYQHGVAELKHLSGHPSMVHYNDNAGFPLKRKFRIWRCDIPRNNAPLSMDSNIAGISRKAVKPLDRMRNPWLFIKLRKNAQENMLKTEINDVLLTYFV